MSRQTASHALRSCISGVILFAVLLLATASARGPVGSAQVPEAAERNLLSNGSFERSLKRWAPYHSTLRIVSGGVVGARAARITLNGYYRDYSIYLRQKPVTSTKNGALYTARAWIRGNHPGRQACLRIREWQGDSVVGSAQVCRRTATTWHRFARVRYRARASGAELDAYVYQIRAREGDSFDVDGVVLTERVDLSPASEPDETAAVGLNLPPLLPESTGRVFYVSPSGSNRNLGTESRPWRTVQHAFNTLRPGQTALVRAGVYEANHYMRRNGRPSAPITVKAYPGETPVFHAASSAPTHPLSIRAAYVRISGFIIEKAPVDSQPNVYVVAGAHHVEISHNELRYAVRSAGLFADPGAHHVQILWNRVHHNNGPDQHQGIYVQSSDSVIAGNVVYGHTNGFGIQVRHDDGDGPDNVIIAGNTTVGNSEAGIVVEDSARGTKIVNNIAAFNGYGGIRAYNDGDPIGGGNVAWNNILYGNGPGDCIGNGTILCLDNIVADPRFADRSGNDYRLVAGSPAIDRAAADYALTPDFDGKRRTAPDLGAFEL